MPSRYGSKKKAISFDALVDAVGGDYPLEYLGRPTVRRYAEQYGITYPDDFEEALAEERAENPKYRGKKVPTAHPKAATKPHATRRKRATSPRVTPQSAPKTAQKPASKRTGASKSTRKAVATKPAASPRKTPTPRAKGTASAAQLKRADKITAYNIAEHVVTRLADRVREPGIKKIMGTTARTYRGRRESMLATYKKHAGS